MIPSSTKAFSQNTSYPTYLVDTLPLDLFGIHIALKEDIHSSREELVNDTTLCLPGEFFETDSSLFVSDPVEYVIHFKSHHSWLD